MGAAPGNRGGPPANPSNAVGVLLVVTELVTNALRCTGGPCALHRERHGDHLAISVTDAGPCRPRPRPPHTDGTGGWGWLLINRLTTHSRIEPTPEGGKTICAHSPW
ncbi:ATP-binding protein [Streptomyces virginiae]|uniref:ATP-binding protein n=1 Tax=Streptomyces virginiae TaxID=1961 RepID=UPI002257635D|nr:ATP-binding protein [Streptomyces virginiae]MCX5277982.1 ATP-binding protein [Streptomyces virginiae]